MPIRYRPLRKDRSTKQLTSPGNHSALTVVDTSIDRRYVWDAARCFMQASSARESEVNHLPAFLLWQRGVPSMGRTILRVAAALQ
jgi:hypothetical protein